MKFDSIPLLYFRNLSEYKPQISDFVIWTGWITSWSGVVRGIENDDIHILFGSMPYMLSTTTEEEYPKHTRKISFSKIKQALKGTWAFQQYDKTANTTIWYI